MAQARNIRMHQYLDDCLIRARDTDTCFQDTQTLLALCQELGWVVNLKKSELEPKQIFSFVGYQYDLIQGVVRPTPERWEALNSKINSLLKRTSCSVRQLLSLIGLLTATEKQVPSGRRHMRPRIFGECHSDSQVHSSPPALVVKGGKRPARPTLASPLSRGSDLYRRIKQRLGCTFRRLYRKRCLVSSQKQTTYQFPGIESSFVGPKEVRTPLPGSSGSSCHRQYYSGGLHKQRRRHAFRIPLCSPVETPVLVQSQGNLPEGTSHSGPAQCDSRQTVPTPSSHWSFCSDLSQMASSQGGPVCDEVHLQTPSVCVPSPRSQSMGRGWVEPVMGGSGPVCISPSSPPDKCSDKGSQPSVQKDDNSSPGLAEHALVLGSGGDVISNPILSPQSPVPAIQRQPSQGSAKSEPSCLAPRTKNIREHGFSDQVATRIEAPQRRSTRFVYEAKWDVFV